MEKTLYEQLVAEHGHAVAKEIVDTVVVMVHTKLLVDLQKKKHGERLEQALELHRKLAA